MTGSPQTGCWCSLSRRRESWWRWRTGNLIVPRPVARSRSARGMRGCCPDRGSRRLAVPAAAAAVVVMAGRGCRVAGHRVRLGGHRHHSRLLGRSIHTWCTRSRCWPINVAAPATHSPVTPGGMAPLQPARLHRTHEVTARQPLRGRPPTWPAKAATPGTHGRDQPTHPGGALCGGRRFLRPTEAKVAGVHGWDWSILTRARSTISRARRSRRPGATLNSSRSLTPAKADQRRSGRLGARQA